MTPKFRSVPIVLAKLQHSLDAQAQKFHEEAAEIEHNVTEAFAKARDQLASARAAVEDIKKIVADIDTPTNAGPTLDDSQGSSGPQG